jgi:hypothetical protein
VEHHQVSVDSVTGLTSSLQRHERAHQSAIFVNLHLWFHCFYVSNMCFTRPLHPS